MIDRANHKKSQKVTNIFAGATPEQVRWVLARLSCNSDQAAAKMVGVHRSTVSRWPNKSQLDEAVRILLQAPAEAALKILRQSSADAAQVLVTELTSRKNRLAAANSILDRVLGKAAQPLTGAGGGPISVVRELTDDELAAIAAGNLASSSSDGTS